MKTKIYMVRIDEDVVVGFAKYNNHGLGSAILDAKGKSKREMEHSMKNRFYSQRQNMASAKGVDITGFNGFDFVWLDFNEITNPRQKQMAFDNGEPRVWSIEEKDGHYKPVKVEHELMTATECKLEIMKRMGF